jgi:hypothetical protein
MPWLRWWRGGLVFVLFLKVNHGLFFNVCLEGCAWGVSSAADSWCARMRAAKKTFNNHQLQVRVHMQHLGYLW